MKEFIIAGGDFLRTEGVLTKVGLDENRGKLELISEDWFEHPDTLLTVEGKGFTGLCLDGKSVWACFSNTIVLIDIDSKTIAKRLSDENFNDLHQIEMHGSKLYIANTGNESIDILDTKDDSIQRIDLLGSGLRSFKPDFHQHEDTKPHLHHLSSVTLNGDDELLLGLVRQSRIINLNSWNWIGPRMPGPVHDVYCDENDSIWCTSVPGQIHRFSNEGEHDIWEMKDYQEIVGWTRGLAITEQGILVGTTAIRESNADYFSSFTEQRVGQVPAMLTWIPFDRTKTHDSLLLPNPFTRKVFSVVEL